MGGQWEIKCLECGKLIPREGKICPSCRSDKAASIEAMDAPAKKAKEEMAKGWQDMKASMARMRERDANRSTANKVAWYVGTVAVLGVGAYFMFR
jgi:hypothetical protein